MKMSLWSSLLMDTLCFKVEQIRHFQSGYTAEASEEFSKVHMQNISFSLSPQEGFWKLCVLF